MGWDDKGSKFSKRPFHKANNFKEVSLLAANMTVMSMEQCQEDYFWLNYSSKTKIVPNFEFCVKPSKKDSCHGDSGGPFICEEGGKAVLQACIGFTFSTFDRTENFPANFYI